MTRVEIHSKADCPHCATAREFLADRNIPFTEIKHDDDAERQAFYDELELTGSQRTVPQVLLVHDEGFYRIGGARELAVSGIESLFRSAA